MNPHQLIRRLSKSLLTRKMPGKKMQTEICCSYFETVGIFVIVGLLHAKDIMYYTNIIIHPI